jgi:hypothetical protein
MQNKNHIELADIFHAGFAPYCLEKGPVPLHHYKVAQAIMDCRTSNMGGHIDCCDECGHEQISYNSCRNRHCPRCQAFARAKWVEDRIKELLPVRYFHVVFTIPHELNHFALQNKKAFYSILFKAVSETLNELANDPERLGVTSGFIAILHTWGQNLMDHPHIHCIVPGGGLKETKKGAKWKHSRKDFIFPFRVMASLFKGKLLAYFKKAFDTGEIKCWGILQNYREKSCNFKSLLDSLYKTDWVVYAKPPFAGPEAVIKYLGNYTHRIAISNARLVSVENGKVNFKWKSYADDNKTKLMTLPIAEFIRRFLLHVLPKGFMRIRQYGFLSNRVRSIKLKLCMELLGKQYERPASRPQKWHEVILELKGEDRTICPVCRKGRLRFKEKLLKSEYSSAA